MASGMPATATMDQVTAIAAAYGIERCEVDVINTTIHVAAYRGPTSPPASTLHIVQSRSMDFSRLAAVDRLIGRIRAGQVLSVAGPRRTRRHHHRAAPVQALGRHPCLGCAGVRDGGNPRRGLAGLSGQRAERHDDRPGQSARSTGTDCRSSSSTRSAARSRPRPRWCSTGSAPSWGCTSNRRWPSPPASSCSSPDCRWSARSATSSPVPRSPRRAASSSWS